MSDEADDRSANGAHDHRIIERLEQWFEERFALLDALARELVGGLSVRPDGLLDITESERRRMRLRAERYLRNHSVVDGCGLIFARSMFASDRGHLEWWVREDESRFELYSFGVVPGGDRYYDYEHHDWYVQAYHEGRKTLVGPYYDYLGVESYVVTLTVPAEVDGVLVGAAGNDIQVADLEAALLPTLCESTTVMAVLGNRGNVLVSNSAELLPGMHVPESAENCSSRPLGPANSGLRLIVAD